MPQNRNPATRTSTISSRAVRRIASCSAMPASRGNQDTERSATAASAGRGAGGRSRPSRGRLLRSGGPLRGGSGGRLGGAPLQVALFPGLLVVLGVEHERREADHLDDQPVDRRLREGQRAQDI